MVLVDGGDPVPLGEYKVIPAVGENVLNITNDPKPLGGNDSLTRPKLSPTPTATLDEGQSDEDIMLGFPKTGAQARNAMGIALCAAALLGLCIAGAARKKQTRG